MPTPSERALNPRIPPSLPTLLHSACSQLLVPVSSLCKVSQAHLRCRSDPQVGLCHRKRSGGQQRSLALVAEAKAAGRADGAERAHAARGAGLIGIRLPTGGRVALAGGRRLAAVQVGAGAAAAPVAGLREEGGGQAQAAAGALRPCSAGQPGSASSRGVLLPWMPGRPLLLPAHLAEREGAASTSSHSKYTRPDTASIVALCPYSIQQVSRAAASGLAGGRKAACSGDTRLRGRAGRKCRCSCKS